MCSKNPCGSKYFERASKSVKLNNFRLHQFKAYSDFKETLVDKNRDSIPFNNNKLIHLIQKPFASLTAKEKTYVEEFIADQTGDFFQAWERIYGKNGTGVCFRFS
jgi:hypothetical protein